MTEEKTVGIKDGDLIMAKDKKEDKKNEGQKVYDILKNINQAAANAWDGSHDERFIPDGETPKKVGLNREQGDLIFDSRLVDGFRVKIRDNILTVSYQAEISTKDFHKKDIKKDADDKMSEILKYLKKEYKSLAGSALSVKEVGEANILMQSMSSIRHTMNVVQNYEIKGIDATTEDEEVESQHSRFAKFVKDLK